MVLSVSPGFAQPYPNTTNTNPPVFVGPTNLTAKVGDSFFFQPLVGGVNRDWVGSDKWSTLRTNNGRLVTNNGQILFSPTSTNPAQAAVGELAWASALPLNQSWLAYVQALVPTTLAATNGRSALAYLQLFQSNQFSGSGTFSNSSRIGWGRGFASSSSNTLISDFQSHNAPYVTTNFSSNEAGFFTSASGGSRASLVFSNLGTTNHPTNRLVYRSTTNGTLFAGAPGSAAALAMPSLLLPSASSWQVTATVNLDPSKINEWTDENQGFSIGLNLAKHVTNQTALQLMANRVALEFGWQWDGGGVVREIFAGGANAVDSGLKLPLFGGGNLDGINTLRLSFAYDASTKTLRSYYEDPVDGWLPADDGLDLAGSLGDSWSFDAEKGFFRLILSANSNYALFDDEVSIGAGNAVPGREVPVFFSQLEVVVQPENAAPMELADESLWLILKYDGTTRELTQGYLDESSDSTIFLPATVVNLNSWAANVPLQLRLGASSAQSTNPANGIRLKNFSVVPGEGQLVYSLVNNPGDFRIDSDLGTVTATNLPNAGPISFTVQASNPASGRTANQTFRLNVGAALPQLAVTSSNLPLRYGSNTASALVVTATNTNELGTNPILFSAPNLPAGLSFTTTSNSLTIRGTPTVVTAGTNLVITASNVAGTASLTSSITIQPAVPRLQLVQNRPNPQYSSANVTGWSNAYWTVRVSNTAGQSAGAFPNVITVSNLPPGLLFRTEGSPVAAPGGVATNIGIISLATNRITNADTYANIVFTASNVSGVSTMTSSLTVLSTVPVLSLVTSPGGATNSGSPSSPVFANLAFGASNANWFRITNTLEGVPVTYTMQEAPRGLVINPSSGVVSGRIDQAINASNVVFRGTNSAGASTVLRIRISTLPPAPILSVVTNRSSNGVATDVLVLTVNNFSNMGTNLTRWSTTATTATNSQGNPGRFSLATNANRSVFTVRTTTGSTNAGIYSNITVTASNSGGVTVVTTNLVVLPEIPGLEGVSNLVALPQFGEASANALQVSLARPARQNLDDFPVTFPPISGLPASWSLRTNASSAWLSTDLAEEATNATVRFTASNAAGSFSTNLVLRVLPLPPEIAVTTNSNRLQFGSAASTNFLRLEVESFGQNVGQFPVTWRISNAPPGVNLSTSNNALVNFVGGANPTRAGVFSNVQIIASNAGGAATNFCDLTVFPQAPQIRLVTNRTQYGVPNPSAVAISVTNANPSNSLGLGSDGFGITFTASNPPASLNLAIHSSTNATLGGIPDRATNATFTLTVSNLAGSVSTNVNLRILPAAPQLSVVTARAQYQSNSPAALTVTVTNTNANAQNPADFPIGFSVSPAVGNLVFATNGTVGTFGATSPNVVTNSTVTVTVTNAGGTNTTNVSLSVLPALPLFSVTNNRTQFGTNSANALVVTVTNTAGQNTNANQFPAFTFSSPNLPLGGIAFTNTNGLTGRAGSTNPTLATNAVITVVVSNAAGATTNTNVSFRILPALPQFTLATNRAQIGVNSPGALIATVNTTGQNTDSFPISFSVTPALAGLGFTNTNGLVGTYGGTNPAVVTNTILTVVASNAAGSVTNSTNFSVLPGLVTFTNLASLPVGSLNNAYNNSANLGFELRFDPAVQNDTNYTIFHTNLPPGLFAIRSPAGARIRGTPSSPGIFSNAQVIFSNAGGSSTNTFTMRILPAAPQISVINNGATFGVDTTNALVVTVNNPTGQNTSNFPISFSVSPTLAGLAFISTNGLVGTYGGTNPAVVTNATLTVTVTNAGGTNQTNILFQVAKASSTVAVTGTNDFTYSGSALGPTTYTNTGSTGAVTFSYAGTNSTVYAASSNRPTNAGDYTAVATVAADSNYNGTNSAAFAFTISKGGSTIAVTGTNDFTYSGSALGPTTYTNTGSTGAVTFSYAGTNSTVYAASSNRPTNAGDYTAVATVAADSNYHGTNSPAFLFAIDKANLPTVLFTAPGSLTYDGTAKAHTADATGPSSLTLIYTGRGTTIYTNTMAPTNVGDYTVTATTDDSNYSGSRTTNFSITAKELMVTGAVATNRAYDGTVAVAVSGGTLSGVVGTEEVTLGGTPSGTVASAGVGIGKAVTVTGYTIGGADSGNYSLAQPTGLTVDISSRALTGSFVASHKAYDGNDSATVVSRAVTGKVGSDDVDLAGGTATFANAALGMSKVVTLTDAVLTGAAADNYSLSSVNTTTADITAKELTVTGAVATGRVYDGSTAVTVSGGTLSGVVGTEEVALGGTPSGTVASAGVGIGKAVTVTGYTIGGADSGNYSLAQPTDVTVNITAKELMVTGAVATNRAYDGTVAVAVSGGTLSGVVGTEEVALGGTPSGTVASVGVGSGKPVTVTGYTIGGADSGNYSLTQPTDVTVNITAKGLTITGASAVNRAYNATAIVVVSGGELFGVLEGDTVTLGGSPAGTVASAGVGTGKAVTVTGYTIGGADSGNYSLAQPTDVTANITAKELTVTGAVATNRVYDGSTAVVVGGGALSGVLGMEEVTLGGSPVGAVASAGVGTGKAVTVTGYTIGGADSGNYSLTQPTGLTVDIEPGAPEIVGANPVSLTGEKALYANTYFRYQISARSAGQLWAGRSDFPSNSVLTNTWSTNAMVVTDAESNPEATLNASNGYLQYTWATHTETYAYLVWSQPLPANSPWLASVSVNFASNSMTGYKVSNLSGLGLSGNEYLAGLLTANWYGADSENYVDAVFAGYTAQTNGYTTANGKTNSLDIIEAISTNTSTASVGWIGLKATTNGGVKQLHVLGNPFTNNPTWSTNLSLLIDSWTNSIHGDNLVLTLSGNSKAPIHPAFALEFKDFVVVPLGDLHYSATTPLPDGLFLDEETGLIYGNPTALTNNQSSTITISNSHGTTNLIIQFDIQAAP